MARNLEFVVGKRRYEGFARQRPLGAMKSQNDGVARAFERGACPGTLGMAQELGLRSC